MGFTNLNCRIVILDIINCAFYVIEILEIRRGITMNVSIGDRWEGFVEQVVKDGRYSSASEVVREGLRLVEEREARLVALRASLDASINLGGEVSELELDEALNEKSKELRAKGLGA